MVFVSVGIVMIKNKITYLRSRMNRGKGITQAELARRVGVGRSFVTKLEKGTGQPGAELMLRVAWALKQPVEAVFRWVNGGKAQTSIICAQTIPISQHTAFASVAAKPMCNQLAAPSARPAGMVQSMDKSLVGPTAKVVAFLSRSKPNEKT